MSGPTDSRLQPDQAGRSFAPPACSAMSGHLNEAEAKAWDSLRRYKFMQFGYWAAIWVHLNRVSGLKRGNPWKCIVQAARVTPNKD